MLLVFDVDGTLTPSRGRINEGFRLWLLNDLAQPFVLITGSDPAKTREQIGDDLFESTTVYNCTGNHVFEKGVETYRSDWRVPDTLETYLDDALNESSFEYKTGKHIEHRVGLCNFSVVGRNATIEQRKLYFEWDGEFNERIEIADRIRKHWPDVDVGVAGETGIDIYRKGTGKDQIVDRIADAAPLHFFGDRMEPGGNDHSLAEAIKARGLGKCYQVRDWRETWDILRSMA